MGPDQASKRAASTQTEAQKCATSLEQGSGEQDAPGKITQEPEVNNVQPEEEIAAGEDQDSPLLEAQQEEEKAGGQKVQREKESPVEDDQESSRSDTQQKDIEEDENEDKFLAHLQNVATALPPSPATSSPPQSLVELSSHAKPLL